MNAQIAQDFDRWNHTVQAVCGRFVTQRPAESGTFFGDISHQDLGGLNLADIRVNAQSIRREKGSATRGDDSFYFLVLQRQGSMVINRDHQQFLLQPGEMALLDSAQAFEMQPQGLINQLSIHLSRDAVDRVLTPGVNRFAKLEQDNLSGRLLYCLLQQIIEGDVNTGVDRQHGVALQDALVSLLQPMMVIDADDATRPLRRMAERLIDKMLLNPPTPNELAARLNISVRQLYRQFELDGDSVCRYIQRQRLLRSAQELTSGSTVQPITTIAYKWGFTDCAHFSRVFKRHYGMSPRAYRADALRKCGVEVTL